MSDNVNILQTLSPEYQAQWEEAERKKQMAQALMKQYQTTGGVVMPQQGGRMASKVSPLNAIAGVLGNYMTNKGLSGAQEAQSGIRTKAAEETQAGMQELMNNPDKQAAIASALTSSNPMLKAWGQQERQRLDAQRKAIADSVSKYDAVTATRLHAGAPMPTPEQIPGMPQPEVRQVDDGTGAGKTIPYLQSIKEGGLPSATPLGPTTRVETTNKFGEKAETASFETVMKGASTKMTEYGEQARAARTMNNTLEVLSSKSKDGVISGPATVPLTWIAGFTKSMGMDIAGKNLSNTETFNAFANEAVQNMISQMPRGNAGITAPEAARIALILPNAAQSAEARAEITEILKRANARTIDFSKKMQGFYVDGLKKNDTLLLARVMIGDDAEEETAPKGAPPVPAQPTQQGAADVPAMMRAEAAANTQSGGPPIQFNLNGVQGTVSPTGEMIPGGAEPLGFAQLSPDEKQKYYIQQGNFEKAAAVMPGFSQLTPAERQRLISHLQKQGAK